MEAASGEADARATPSALAPAASARAPEATEAALAVVAQQGAGTDAVLAARIGDTVAVVRSTRRAGQSGRVVELVEADDGSTFVAVTFADGGVREFQPDQLRIIEYEGDHAGDAVVALADRIPGDGSPQRPDELCICDGDVDVRVWRYEPPSDVGVFVRKVPDVEGEMSGQLVAPGDAFRVDEEFRGADGVLYLHLADGRGWLFDAKPGTEPICRRVAPVAECLPAKRRSLAASTSDPPPPCKSFRARDHGDD